MNATPRPGDARTRVTETPATDEEPPDLTAEVRDIAEHLQHAAQLALASHPEEGAGYLLDTLHDLCPRIAALSRSVRP